MTKLAGILCTRNATALDYPWVQVGKCFLEFCDELLICDSDSEDGTRKAIDGWAAEDSRVTVCNFPWTNPVRDNQFYPLWLNYARQHAKSDHAVYLDADELFHESDYVKLREAADAGKTLFMKRLNFWRDAKSLIPDGVCCGTKVLRMAPKNMPICSDYPYEPANATIAQAVESDIQIFHVGFLRHRKAFFAKARVVQQIWAGGFDPRLEAAEKFEGNWMSDPQVVEWNDRLVEFKGTHPEIIKPWLRERKHHVD